MSSTSEENPSDVSTHLTAFQQLHDALNQCLKFEAEVEHLLKNKEDVEHLACAKTEADTTIAELERCLGRNKLAEQRATELKEEMDVLQAQSAEKQGKIEALETEKAELLQSKEALEEEKKTNDGKLGQLEEEKKANDAKVEQLEAEKKAADGRLEQLEEEKKTNDGKLVELGEEKTRLTSEVASKEEMVKKLESDLAEAQKSAELHKETIEKLKRSDEDNREITKDVLDKLESRTDEIKSWTSNLVDQNLSVLQREISSICFNTHDLAMRYFRLDFSSIQLKPHKIPELLKKLQKLPGLKELNFIPTTDSDTAKDFRAALAFAALTDLMIDYVFCPCFVPDGDTLHKLLKKQAYKDQSREALCRALILSLYDGDRVFSAHRKAEFEGDVEAILYPLLPSDQQKDFDTALHALFDEAAKLWKKLQHNKKRIDLSMSMKDCGAWVNLFQASHRDSSVVSQTESNGGTDRATTGGFPLFPAFYIISDEGQRKLFFQGFDIAAAQVADARAESRQLRQKESTETLAPSKYRANRTTRQS